MSVIWHDLECGGYRADLPVWQRLAASTGSPILDVGAGTGRVTLDLARSGHTVCALDSDPSLLDELTRRAEGCDVSTACADARSFALGRRFPLIIVPMQTIQLLEGDGGRAAFLGCARDHLDPGGRLAIAIASELEPFEIRDGGLGPLPDVCEREGVVYSSLPTAVRVSAGGFWLERNRETVTVSGDHHRERDRIHLDALTADTLTAEGRAAGLTPGPVMSIAATSDHVGSEVVIFGA